MGEAGGVPSEICRRQEFLMLIHDSRAVFKNYFSLILLVFVYFFICLYLFILSTKKNSEEIFLRDIIEHSFIDCVADKKHTKYFLIISNVCLILCLFI